MKYSKSQARNQPCPECRPKTPLSATLSQHPSNISRLRRSLRPTRRSRQRILQPPRRILLLRRHTALRQTIQRLLRRHLQTATPTQLVSKRPTHPTLELPRIKHPALIKLAWNTSTLINELTGQIIHAYSTITLDITLLITDTSQSPLQITKPLTA
jgi:hypothetical protein